MSSDVKSQQIHRAPQPEVKSKYSRRELLKTLGVGGAMLPLLHAERASGATASGFPKRMVIVTWTNGIVPKDFFPPVGPLATAALPAILQPLDAWKSKIQVLRNMGSATSPIDMQVMIDNNQRYDGHNSYPSLLTGSIKGATPSIDQIIGDAIKAMPTGGHPSPQLNVGVRPFSSATSWRGSGTKNSAETDPYRLFTRLFSGRTASPAVVNALRLRRQSVIDLVKPELTRFSNRVGRDDKIKVQAHLDSIRQMEVDLAAMPATTTAACAPVAPTAGVKFASDYPQHAKMMFDQIAMAVKCDIARTVTLDLIDDGGGNSLTFPWLSIPSPDYHAIAHKGSGGYAQKVPIDTWYYTQVAGMVKQLAESVEGAGSALDNSVVVVTNDMNEGSNHGTFATPFCLIGSCGGFFPKTGRSLGFAKAVPHNQLLTTLCHAMDVPVASVGVAKFAGNIDTILTT